MHIYVGNLSYQASEDDIRNAFAEFGSVAAVNIVQDRETGRSRGFAFVEMPDANEAKAAIEGLNTTAIAGRNVTVNEARPREDHGGGGGRGGYGGGGNYSGGGERGGGDRGSSRGGGGQGGSNRGGRQRRREW